MPSVGSMLERGREVGALLIWAVYLGRCFSAHLPARCSKQDYAVWCDKVRGLFERTDQDDLLLVRISVKVCESHFQLELRRGGG